MVTRCPARCGNLSRRRWWTLIRSAVFRGSGPALDAISSQRRPLSDPLGLRPALLASARRGLTFGELAATAAYEPLARAQLLHLIWRRQLGVNLAEPLADRSPVAAAREAAA